MAELYKDTYLTIDGSAEATYKSLGSKFFAYAYPVDSAQEADAYVDALRKKHYDATHHCFSWRLGQKGDTARCYDDGEPSSTAGRPILGVMLSNDITNLLIVVVRYFGGTKLGVAGLIEAYKGSAAAVIESATIVERIVYKNITINYSYADLKHVMKIIKLYSPKIKRNDIDNLCTMEVLVREVLAEAFVLQFTELNEREKKSIEVVVNG